MFVAAIPKAEGTFELLVLRIAGDPAGMIGHLPQRDLIPVGDTSNVAVDRIVE